VEQRSSCAATYCASDRSNCSAYNHTYRSGNCRPDCSASCGTRHHSSACIERFLLGFRARILDRDLCGRIWIL
jgi:hypothetical protein